MLDKVHRLPLNLNDLLSAHARKVDFKSIFDNAVLRYLRSIPGGTSALHNRCTSGNTSKTQPRRRLLSKFTSPSLDSATATTMSCTILHRPSTTKAFPFLPDGTAYLLSDEQHRAVEQSLCSTKLLLHRLKRLLIEVGWFLSTGLLLMNLSPLHKLARDILRTFVVGDNLIKER